MKNFNLSFTIAAIAAVTMSLFSCKNGVKMNVSFSNDSTATSSTDTLWNDQVQNKFFDTEFGATRDEVIKNFANYGFIVFDDLSDDETLVFGHKSDTYTFGGMQWVNLNASIKDGKFYSISFYTPRRDKDQAMNDFNDIVANLSKKYQLTNVVSEDTTMYALKRAYSKTPYIAGVGCYSYFDSDSVKFYTTSLDYTDLDIANEANPDL